MILATYDPAENKLTEDPFGKGVSPVLWYIYETVCALEKK